MCVLQLSFTALVKLCSAVILRRLATTDQDHSHDPESRYMADHLHCNCIGSESWLWFTMLPCCTMLYYAVLCRSRPCGGCGHCQGVGFSIQVQIDTVQYTSVQWSCACSAVVVRAVQCSCGACSVVVVRAIQCSAVQCCECDVQCSASDPFWFKTRLFQQVPRTGC
jgi:hypothetical protein